MSALTAVAEPQPRPRHLRAVNSHWVWADHKDGTPFGRLHAQLRPRRPCRRARSLVVAFAGRVPPTRPSRTRDLDRGRDQARGADQERRRHGDQAGRATCASDADAAFQKNDFRTGMLVLGQLVTAAPERRRRAGCGSRAPSCRSSPRDDKEKALLLDRASTAAYIAYQRASDRSVEADSLALLGRTLADRKLWRPALDAMRLSLEHARDRRAARPI